MTEVRRCACRGEIKAEPDTIALEVSYHQRQPQHRDWRRGWEERVPSYEMVKPELLTKLARVR